MIRFPFSVGGSNRIRIELVVAVGRTHGQPARGSLDLHLSDVHVGVELLGKTRRRKSAGRGRINGLWPRFTEPGKLAVGIDVHGFRFPLNIHRERGSSCAAMHDAALYAGREVRRCSHGSAGVCYSGS